MQWQLVRQHPNLPPPVLYRTIRQTLKANLNHHGMEKQQRNHDPKHTAHYTRKRHDGGFAFPGNHDGFVDRPDFPKDYGSAAQDDDVACNFGEDVYPGSGA